MGRIIVRSAIYLIIAFLLFGWATQNWSAERLTPKQIENICHDYNYHNCTMVASIAMVESSYNPNAYNESEDAYGLAQIKCTTARSVGLKYSCKQLFSPRINIRFMVLYLRSLEASGLILERHLIAAYNAGSVYYCKRLKRNKWLGGGICTPGSLVNELYVFKVTRVLNYLRGV